MNKYCTFDEPIPAYAIGGVSIDIIGYDIVGDIFVCMNSKSGELNYYEFDFLRIVGFTNRLLVSYEYYTGSIKRLYWKIANKLGYDL